LYFLEFRFFTFGENSIKDQRNNGIKA